MPGASFSQATRHASNVQVRGRFHAWPGSASVSGLKLVTSRT